MRGWALLVSMTVLAACGEAAPARGDEAAGVEVLPLRRGFYVASDTPCGQASNATLTLLRRDGVGGSRDFCAFVKIEKTGETSYRITETCSDLQVGPESETTSVVEWEIPDDASFRRVSDGGWEHSARYCEQSSLPEDWRDNDISDLIQ